MKRKNLMVLVLVSTTALSGCGGAPSDSDVRAAMLKFAAANGAGMFGSEYKDVIAKAKVVGCVKADAGGYKCDVSNAAGAVSNMRFVKTEAGWSIVN